jgi:hypothetical protein
MVRKRFDTAPKINVKDEGLLIQQATGSTANLLEIKDAAGNTLVSYSSSGIMTTPITPAFNGGISTTDINASGNVIVTGGTTLSSNTSIGNVSSTEIGYLDGVSSAIQTQLNGKLTSAVTSLSGTSNQITANASTGSVNLSLPSTVTVSGKVSVGGAGYHPGMPSGSLELGNTATNYYYTSGWSGTMGAGMLASCLDRFEWVVHDSSTRLASPMYYEGETNNIYIGRDLGWGPTRVVTTGQPSFLAYRSANYSTGAGQLLYNATTFNQGNHYNTGTYTFTAPVAGTYLFCLNINMYSANGFTVMATILKNGGTYINGERKLVNTSGDFNITATGLVYLNKDETAAPYLYASSTVTLSGGQVWNSFGGFLLG